VHPVVAAHFQQACAIARRDDLNSLADGWRVLEAAREEAATAGDDALVDGYQSAIRQFFRKLGVVVNWAARDVEHYGG
jgi:hypothetical protein